MRKVATGVLIVLGIVLLVLFAPYVGDFLFDLANWAIGLF